MGWDTIFTKQFNGDPALSELKPAGTIITENVGSIDVEAPAGVAAPWWAGGGIYDNALVAYTTTTPTTKPVRYTIKVIGQTTNANTCCGLALFTDVNNFWFLELRNDLNLRGIYILADAVVSGSANVLSSVLAAPTPVAPLWLGMDYDPNDTTMCFFKSSDGIDWTPISNKIISGFTPSKFGVFSKNWNPGPGYAQIVSSYSELRIEEKTEVTPYLYTKIFNGDPVLTKDNPAGTITEKLDSIDLDLALGENGNWWNTIGNGPLAYNITAVPFSNIVTRYTAKCIGLTTVDHTATGIFLGQNHERFWWIELRYDLKLGVVCIKDGSLLYLSYASIYETAAPTAANPLWLSITYDPINKLLSFHKSYDGITGRQIVGPMSTINYGNFVPTRFGVWAKNWDEPSGVGPFNAITATWSELYIEELKPNVCGSPKIDSDFVLNHYICLPRDYTNINKAEITNYDHRTQTVPFSLMRRPFWHVSGSKAFK